MTIRVAIVDDEPLARQRIRDLLTGEHSFEVVAECEDGIEALRVIPDAGVDLLFLDIQMPGLTGFEVLRELDRRPAIIFTTAYEAYALRAFEEHALDYLLKPLDEARFRDAVARARQWIGKPNDASERIAALLERVERHEKHLRRIVVKSADRVFFVEVREVDWFEAAGNYIRLHTASDTHLVRMTMSALEEKLDPKTFVRIHRSAIVNVSRIAELRSRFRGDYDVVMKSGSKLPMQKAYRDRLRAVMGEF